MIIEEEFPINDEMRRKLSIKEDDYNVSVEGFTDWIKALEEIEIARLKTRIARIVYPESPLSILEKQDFPSWLARAIDMVSFALLVAYPNGMTKEELSTITGMKDTSLTTLLTSKEKKLAEHLTKSDNDEYSVLPSSLHWAVNQLETQKEK